MEKRTDAYLIRSVGEGSCGFCATNSLLKMCDLPEAIFPFSAVRGVSPKRILLELRKSGLIAVPKTISIRNLKPRSMLWYPLPNDHYVVIRGIEDGKALIYDSDKEEPYWLRLPVLKRKWYKLYSGRWRGWVIEVKKPTGEN